MGRKAASFEELLDVILAKLRPAKQQISNLAEKYDAQVSLIAYCHRANIGFHIKKQYLEELASMNIDLDVDLHYIGD